jgi:hypothetical protein
MGLGGPQNWSGYSDDEEKNPYPLRESSSGLPDRGLVTLVTELPGLRLNAGVDYF